MKILAIETSCDETAAAVLEIKNGYFNLLSNLVSSQEKIHAQYGGIVPEVAARKQIEMIIPIINNALNKAKIKNKSLVDYIAVTQGPGLITSLTVGVETAKTLALTLNKPLVAVNHLAGHIYSNLINNSQSPISNYQLLFPALALIVSGGHTQLVLMAEHNKYKIIGQTVDDAAGEAFDKVAKILKLGYPGGPIISKLARLDSAKRAEHGSATAFKLPRPMIQQQNFDFSFSGLKTAVLYLIQKDKKLTNKKNIPNLCASFQQAVIDVLISKILRAAKKYQPKSILLGGGVAANSELRKQLKDKIKKNLPRTPLHVPELKFTGDNAAMIAVAAYYKIKNKKFIDPKKLTADPNLQL